MTTQGNIKAASSPKNRKAFVLLSGGLDSTTCLYKAIYDFGAPDTPEDIKKRIALNISCTEDDFNDPITWVQAYSIDYGQRHRKEMEYAAATCKSLGIAHEVLDVGKILSGANVMLTDESRGSVEVPNISYVDLPHGVSPTYVPFRNGTLLSVITAQAQKWVNEDPDNREAGIYFGAHSEDAANWAYPDCTPEFIAGMIIAIFIGTYMKIRLYAPLQWLNKAEVVALGASLNVPFKDTWSCYKGEPLHCGVCPTCRSRREAFIKAGVRDPTPYATNEL